jgi:hypothetical protein
MKPKAKLFQNPKNLFKEFSLYFFDFLHYLLGLFIVGLIIWIIIKIHTYFSKDNVIIMPRKDVPNTNTSNRTIKKEVKKETEETEEQTEETEEQTEE